MEFKSDYSISATGFNVTNAKVCCNSTPGASYPSQALELTQRYTGVLVAAGDVVYSWVPVGASDEITNIIAWPHVEGTQAPDLDIYVQCNSLPTTSSYLYRAKNTDSHVAQEFLQLFDSAGRCPANGRWYIAVTASNAAGAFNLVVSRMKTSEQRILNVGYPSELNPQLAEDVFVPALEATMREYYGATEGQQVYLMALIYSNIGDNIATGCGGERCDIVYTGDSGFPYATEPCGASTVHMGYVYWDEPDYYVHELAHGNLCDPNEGLLADEYYFYSPRYWYPCPHSLMDMQDTWNSNFNFCVLASDLSFTNHMADGDPLCSGCSSIPPVWCSLYHDLPVVTVPNRTPDNSNYLAHDFNGWMNVIY